MLGVVNLTLYSHQAFSRAEYVDLQQDYQRGRWVAAQSRFWNAGYEAAVMAVLRVAVSRSYTH